MTHPTHNDPLGGKADPIWRRPRPSLGLDSFGELHMSMPEAERSASRHDRWRDAAADAIDAMASTAPAETWRSLVEHVAVNHPLGKRVMRESFTSEPLDRGERWICGIAVLALLASGAALHELALRAWGWLS